MAAEIAGIGEEDIAGSRIFIGFCADRIAQTREILGSDWDTPL